MCVVCLFFFIFYFLWQKSIGKHFFFVFPLSKLEIKRTLGEFHSWCGLYSPIKCEPASRWRVENHLEPNWTCSMKHKSKMKIYWNISMNSLHALKNNFFFFIINLTLMFSFHVIYVINLLMVNSMCCVIFFFFDVSSYKLLLISTADGRNWLKVSSPGFRNWRSKQRFHRLYQLQNTFIWW